MCVLKRCRTRRSCNFGQLKFRNTENCSGSPRDHKTIFALWHTINSNLNNYESLHSSHEEKTESKYLMLETERAEVHCSVSKKMESYWATKLSSTLFRGLIQKTLTQTVLRRDVIQFRRTFLRFCILLTLNDFLFCWLLHLDHYLKPE